MSNEHRKPCPDCNTPDVVGEPLRVAETIHECPNCDRTFTEFDRDYIVADRDDESAAADDARNSNRTRGWWG